jgi:hypothetical protein
MARRLSTLKRRRRWPVAAGRKEECRLRGIPPPDKLEPDHIMPATSVTQVTDGPFTKPDLTKYPPRSPRVRLGGYAILPRTLDKGRALLCGKLGEYKYACPLDQRLFDFAGIDAEELKAQLKAGKSDGEVLDWIQAQSKNKHPLHEVEAWSAWQDRRVPTDHESREFFNELQQQAAPKRADIATWFDLLDLDDYVSFGGKP